MQGDIYAMIITGCAICDYAMLMQNYSTKWSPALCGYGNLPARIYATCSCAIQLQQLAGAKITFCSPQRSYGNTPVTAICRLQQYAGYGNTPAKAIQWRKKYVTCSPAMGLQQYTGYGNTPAMAIRRLKIRNLLVCRLH
jgi:hypothetical protein